MTVSLRKDKNRRGGKREQGPRAWWDFGSGEDPDVLEGKGKEDGYGYEGKGGDGDRDRDREEEEVRYQFVLKPMSMG